MNKIKMFICFALVMAMSGCGYSGVDNELVGQIKKVVHNTPLICSNYDEADISLGIMRNGVGSMSHEDAWVVITPEQKIELKKAVDTGSLVKLTYDVKRVSICTDSNRFLRSVEIMK